MIWQDVVLSTANIVFIYALLPQIIYGHRTRKGLVSLQYSILNIISMIGLCVVYLSLQLWVSAFLDVILIGLWLIIVFQRIKYGKIKTKRIITLSSE